MFVFVQDTFSALPLWAAVSRSSVGVIVVRFLIGWVVAVGFYVVDVAAVLPDVIFVGGLFIAE